VLCVVCDAFQFAISLTSYYSANVLTPAAYSTATHSTNTDDPASFRAATRYRPACRVSSGVPRMSPLVAFSDRPRGSAGDTVKTRGVPLDGASTGMLGLILFPRVYTAGLNVYLGTHGGSRGGSRRVDVPLLCHSIDH